MYPQFASTPTIFLTILLCLISQNLNPLALASKVEYDPSKTKCTHCKTLTKKFQKFMAMSAGKNFGGGDTHWEEKRGTKYKTSEARLLEILDNICGNDFGCAQILEDYEEDIEDWFFNRKHAKKEKKTGDNIYDNPFFQFLCVDQLKFCCENDKKFGSKCDHCPGTENNSVCSGHGKCQGAGDRKGTGKCKCDSGYIGKTCSDCKIKYFKNDKSECEECHKSCKENCSGPSDGECVGKSLEDNPCAKGYEILLTDEDETRRCIDTDECNPEIENPNICKPDEFCKNKSGSYSCIKCYFGCQGCTGRGNKKCIECKSGFEKIEIPLDEKVIPGHDEEQDEEQDEKKEKKKVELNPRMDRDTEFDENSGDEDEVVTDTGNSIFKCRKIVELEEVIEQTKEATDDNAPLKEEL